MKMLSFYFILFFFSISCSYAHNTAITYHIQKQGRLGDHILDYTHAKWISYKTGVPLLFRPFAYSDQFAFHYSEEMLTPERQATFSNQIVIKNLSEVTNDNDNTLYYLGHCPDSLDEFRFIKWHKAPYTPVDWDDEVFREQMRSLISPINPLELLPLPKEIITVALHFRSGVGFDSANIKKVLPLRFPEPTFYIEQLSKLHSLVNMEPLYVYIFTDHPEPDTIRELLQENFPQDNIQFDCRSVNNRHNANVLEDLFSMMQFDCLIRAVSHYSLIASHLGQFKIELFPKKGHWSWPSKKFVVSQTGIIQKAAWDPLSKEWKNLSESSEKTAIDILRN